LNILYLGSYDRTSVDIIQALDAAGANIACRPVKMATAAPVPSLPERVKELTARTLPHYDVCLQHIPPHCMDYDGRVGLNVGLIDQRLRKFPPMDLFVMPCVDYGWVDADPNWSLCPFPVDITRYEQSYANYGGIQKDGRFLFYTIGPLAREHNLAGILRAYYGAFRADEPVCLVIVPSLPGVSPPEAERHTFAICQEIQKGSALKQFPAIQVLTGLTETEVMGIHAVCDCFVKPGYDLGWDADTFDAMAFGKTPIVSNWGAPKYFTKTAGWTVETKLDFALGAQQYDGTETWHSPDLVSVAQTMREAYEEVNVRKEKARRGLERAYDFSYDRRGGQFLKVLAWAIDNATKPKS